MDGPLILNEIIPWLKRKKRARMFFKVDIEKAYDSLKWKFLDSVMEQMKFPIRWRKWIMATVTCARASVLVNGSPTQEFPCFRGLRQEDPLSPFLFIITMEALSCVVKRACDIGLFDGIRCKADGPILSHFMYADDVVKQLERLRKDFLWGSDPEHGKMSWVAWQKIMAPIDVGGVGIGSLKEANIALLAKWWWRFKVDGPCLWRSVIWNLYSSSRQWCDIPVRLSAPGIWKQVTGISKDLWDMEVDLPGLFKGILGSGTNIHFWKDRWALEKPLQLVFPNLFRLERVKNSLVANRVRVEGGIMVLSFEWVREPGSSEELLELEGLLLIMGDVNLGSGMDKWEWKADQSGVYSVRSLRTEMQNTIYPVQEGGFIWHTWASLKNEETTDHLFLSCGLAQAVWDSVSRWCRISPVYAFESKDLVRMHHHLSGSFKWKKVIFTIVQTTVWCMWRCRNEVVFNQKQANVARLVEEIRALGFLWVRSRAKLQEMSWEMWCSFNLPV
ncbi:uncharacterized protein LOC110881535 [Helianthus annuus]|uniref:uncharacterized protein LOC110881535 n=1 Tax=Helianthus annuus TaxID=4232 RepID=UPI000B8F5C26|nr:uncharacterized protein LOC110881535 [Helianthus annuus]